MSDLIASKLDPTAEKVRSIQHAFDIALRNILPSNIDGIKQAVQAFSEGLPKFDNSQLEAIKNSLSIIKEAVDNNDEIFEGMQILSQLINKSADISADSADIKISERHKQILKNMEVGVQYSSDEIAKKIGLKGSRTRQLLNELVAMNLVEYTSTTRGRRYIKQ